MFVHLIPYHRMSVLCTMFLRLTLLQKFYLLFCFCNFNCPSVRMALPMSYSLNAASLMHTFMNVSLNNATSFNLQFCAFRTHCCGSFFSDFIIFFSPNCFVFFPSIIFSLQHLFGCRPLGSKAHLTHIVM